MNKHLIIAVFLISITLMLSNIASAEITEIKDTNIDYVPYREVVVGQGVVYQIKIENTATHEKDYELIPKAEAIKEIGTYRIDPADKITLAGGEEATFYLYLSVEKPVTRAVIPMEIKTGLASTSINLVARSIGPLQPQEQESSPLFKAFKIVIIIALIIIILIAIILSIVKMRKKGEEELEKDFKPEFEENVETYY